MLRVLMVSKACYVAEYRKKLRALVEAGDIELGLVVPPFWRFGREVAPFEPGDDKGYRVFILPPRFNGRVHLHYYPGLGRVLAEFKPDLVHLDEEPYDLVTFHGVRLARQAGAACLFFTWQNMLNPIPPPFSWFQRAVFAGVAGAIAGNADAEQVLRRRGFTGPVAVIPQFGVDPELFCPEPRPRSGPFRVGFVGRLVPEKGADWLLDAMAGLEGDWELLVVGGFGSDPAVRRQIEARLRELGSRWRLLGPFASGQMPEFYRSIDVLVVPSRTGRRWKEQFGRVIVEAQACGVPVVGSDSGEVPRTIGDGGIVVPEGDVLGLRGAIRRLMLDPALRQILGQLGRKQAAARFSHQAIAHRTRAFYRRLITGRDRVRGGLPAAGV
jgi:glycosyltransferase involved in cell wall biosynthesis